ncbi:MAG: hypothetical protein EA404_14410, partial [Spirochaetaceae bacterium]
MTLVLSACGDLSVYGLLDSEEVGPFAMTQSSVNITFDSEHRITAQGGYKQYHYELLEGSAGDLDAETGVYSAPPSPDIEGEDVEESAVVRATDHFGSTDHTTIYIYNRLSVTPAAFSVAMGGDEEWPVTFKGGYGDKSVKQTELGNEASISGGNTLHYTPISAGKDYVEIEDQKGNSVVIAVSVYDSSTLYVDPTSQTAIAGGGEGGKVSFTVGGYTDIDDVTVTWHDDYNSVMTWNEAEREITFLDPLPGIDAPQQIDILITDALNAVTATVYVVDQEPGQVAINPSTVEVRVE